VTATAPEALDREHGRVAHQAAYVGQAVVSICGTGSDHLASAGIR
jgi:hypothetical protein